MKKLVLLLTLLSSLPGFAETEQFCSASDESGTRFVTAGKSSEDAMAACGYTSKCRQTVQCGTRQKYVAPAANKKCDILYVTVKSRSSSIDAEYVTDTFAYNSSDTVHRYDFAGRKDIRKAISKKGYHLVSSVEDADLILSMGSITRPYRYGYQTDMKTTIVSKNAKKDIYHGESGAMERSMDFPLGAPATFISEADQVNTSVLRAIEDLPACASLQP